jgi:hypothetical protein
VDEVVTTLLLNFVVILFVGLMIEGPLRDPLGLWLAAIGAGRRGFPAARPGPAHAPACRPPDRAGGRRGGLADPRAHGLRDGGAAAGFNARAAEFAGVSLPRTIMGVAVLSGGLAGLAGAIEVMGVTGR